MIGDRDLRRSELLQLLGKLPDMTPGVKTIARKSESTDRYLLENLLLDLNGLEPVPATFVAPQDVPPPWPTILYNHAHGGKYEIGKEELLSGRPALQPVPYAAALAAQGYAVLAIDHWGFGERATRSESEIFKEMLWHGRVMWGMMVYDSLRAVEYLVSRADVDAARLGTLGLSMGSTMAWWVAALEPRIKVCIDLCCLTDFEALIAAGGLDLHSIYYYVPGLLNHFTTAEINRLIIPRAHLSLAGNLDPLTPPDGLDRIDRELKGAYAAAGRPEGWQLRRYDVGHVETADMRQAVLSFLGGFL